MIYIIFSDTSMVVSSDLQNYSYSNLCIFCDLERKKRQGSFDKLCTGDLSILEGLKTYAVELDDMEMYDKLKKVNEKCIKYHKICKVTYENKWYSNVEKRKTTWHESRSKHNIAFGKVHSFVEENVITKKMRIILLFYDPCI